MDPPISITAPYQSPARLPRRSSSGVLALSCQEGAGEGAGLKPARFLGELVWNPRFVNEGHFKVVGESRRKI